MNQGRYFYLKNRQLCLISLHYYFKSPYVNGASCWLISISWYQAKLWIFVKFQIVAATTYFPCQLSIKNIQVLNSYV